MSSPFKQGGQAVSGGIAIVVLLVLVLLAGTVLLTNPEVRVLATDAGQVLTVLDDVDADPPPLSNVYDEETEEYDCQRLKDIADGDTKIGNDQSSSYASPANWPPTSDELYILVRIYDGVTGQFVPESDVIVVNGATVLKTLPTGYGFVNIGHRETITVAAKADGYYEMAASQVTLESGAYPACEQNRVLNIIFYLSEESDDPPPLNGNGEDPPNGNGETGSPAATKTQYYNVHNCIQAPSMTNWLSDPHYGGWSRTSCYIKIVMSEDIDIEAVVLDPPTMKNWRVGDVGVVYRGPNQGMFCTISELNVGGPSHNYIFNEWAYMHAKCAESGNTFNIQDGDILSYEPLTREDTLRIYFTHGEEEKYLVDSSGTLSLTTDSEIFVYMPEKPLTPGTYQVWDENKNFFSLFPALVAGAAEDGRLTFVGVCILYGSMCQGAGPVHLSAPNGLLMPYTKVTCDIPQTYGLQPCVLMEERVTSATPFSSSGVKQVIFG